MIFAQRSFVFSSLALTLLVTGCQTSSDNLKAGVTASDKKVAVETATAADGSQVAMASTAESIALPEVAMVPYPRPDGTALASTQAIAGNAYASPTQQANAALAAVAAATPTENALSAAPAAGTVAPRSPELDSLISKYASLYQIPETLLRRVVHRESRFDPGARNGPYWGLMQIRHDTAKGMGYQGDAKGLLDAETNLRYAGKYLRGAYITAEGNPDQAVKFYSRGYYYDAKRKGLLKITGLR
ncbi:lytic transglycosylase domain-containing protein [Limoniibacter endophyticus]|uniref:Lytic transglycosylase n=1 Tax=Limoniibacter endophyticus TaxID=1565040 RepID=A0A8J3DKX9_9HYPH|nr:lytic transglycosylase domain-containing protein [Limoniibacter endophyticus]GHC65908.1 lytic transglycosylase [Limoniibacter endophyticus]